MKKQTLIALAIIGFSAAVSAQPYGVVSVGSARLSVDCEGATNCDKSDTAFKLMGGYKFTPNWAVELGYFDYGRAQASDSGDSAEIANSAIGAGIAFHQDLSANWNFVARLGAARVKTKISASVAGFGSESDSDNNVAAYGGLGIGYKFSKNLSLDLAWDFSNSKYNKNGVDESGSINAYSVGLTLGF